MGDGCYVMLKVFLFFIYLILVSFSLFAVIFVRPAKSQQFVTVPYIFSPGMVANASQVMADFNSLVNNGNAVATALNTQISSVIPLPSGSIVFFYNTACPTGWNQELGWQGLFIRGFDPGGVNDPTTPSHVATTETQGLLSHSHNAVTPNPITNSADASVNLLSTSGNANGPFAASGSETTGTITVNSTGAATLLPPSVGLILCKKV